jgi:flagellar hook-basal body complex protein FliE
MSVSQCHRSAKSNGENRSENGGASFAALIAGFCNNICQKQTYAPQQTTHMTRADFVSLQAT